MNSSPIEVTNCGKNVNLPKPDPANITVLTPKLPNKPILPWTHFDSPWLDKEEREEASTEQEISAGNQDNQSEASADKEKLKEATENQIESPATDSNSWENSDTPQGTTTQQKPTPEILAKSSQLPENKIYSDTTPENKLSDT